MTLDSVVSTRTDFTKDHILAFCTSLKDLMRSRECDTPEYLYKTLTQMTLPRANEVNVSLQVYACNLLFACAIAELTSKNLYVSEQERECACEMLAQITRKYKIAIGQVPTDDERTRSFYKRDILPVFGPFARSLSV
jgi:hypothetical protein